MKVVPIKLSSIDFQDKTFFIGNRLDLSSLVNSIQEVGLLNPPILRDKEGGYQIICGWIRLRACKQLSQSEVLCRVYDSSELSDSEALKIIFYDNKDRITDMELSRLIALYGDLESLDDKELVRNILPSFGIPSSRKHLDKYLTLDSLDSKVKNAFYEDKITIEQCILLSDLTNENQLVLLENVLLKYNLNNNESRQVIQHILEIASIKLKSILDVLSEAQETIGNDKLDKNALREHLKKLRYPDHSKAEDQFKETLQDLKLPKQVNLYTSQSFESNDLEFRIKAKSAKELVDIISELDSLSDKGKLDKLFSIIKGG